MKFKRLGMSDLLVSEVCLGTCTWGLQNNESKAHAQLDYARSRGVNFVDTAEYYPTPIYDHEQEPGASERILGNYLASHPDARSELIISTKVIGYKKNAAPVANRVESPEPLHTRTPFPDARLDKESIRAACDASLHRLQTHYIDLYFLHWPDRYVPKFGNRGYDIKKERESVPIRETLLALNELLNEGKIRAYGLSNETTFGLCQFVRIADELEMMRPAAIQNSFSLLDRQFECELAEACSPRNFNVGFMPWSILGGGTLSGKYRKMLDSGDDEDVKKTLQDARYIRFGNFMHRYITTKAIRAAAKYEDIAREHGLKAATLAQAFCKSRWFVTSSIIAATKTDQLEQNLDAVDIDLDEELVRKINVVHNQNKDVVINFRQQRG